MCVTDTFQQSRAEFLASGAITDCSERYLAISIMRHIDDCAPAADITFDESSLALTIIWPGGIRIESRRVSDDADKDIASKWTLIGYEPGQTAWNVNPGNEIQRFVAQMLMGADPRIAVLERMAENLPRSWDNDSDFEESRRIIQQTVAGLDSIASNALRTTTPTGH